ncbi:MULTISPECIES: ornithine carbamoyltransferase [Spirulina sp. CCY15215]|uniref:ornithine carbamoyltransferase n=1 Tax=Spirulina sp. CCY15215 TaxID=2767591 RepID=UPI00194EC5F8|nr:ornithine carbamoyltransferase [Spirulina major]
MQHFLSLLDWPAQELMQLIDRAKTLKQEFVLAENSTLLQGQNLALLFERASLRTRVSFEIAMRQLGGDSLYLHGQEIGWGKRESIPDIARTFGNYVQGIVVRINDYQKLQELAQWSAIPIINGLTAYNHPCQGMADALTLYEEFGHLQGLEMAYLGRSNQDVARSLLFAAVKLGFRLVISSPEAYSLDEDSLNLARSLAGKTVVRRVDDPQRAVKTADALYTDVWISRGKTDEVEAGNRGRILAPYQINDRLLEAAPDRAIVMHCMPVNREQEITNSVADGDRSRLFQQAENRLHLQKALLLKLLT